MATKLKLESLRRIIREEIASVQPTVTASATDVPDFDDAMRTIRNACLNRKDKKSLAAFEQLMATLEASSTVTVDTDMIKQYVMDARGPASNRSMSRDAYVDECEEELDDSYRAAGFPTDW